MNYKIVKLQGLDSQNFISQQYYKNRDLSERSYKEQNIYFVNLITSFSAKNFINSHKNMIVTALCEKNFKNTSPKINGINCYTNYNSGL